MIESFNETFRDECLQTYRFLSRADARSKIEHRRIEYHEYRPHSSLSYKTPSEFAQEHELPDPAR